MGDAVNCLPAEIPSVEVDFGAGLFGMRQGQVAPVPRSIPQVVFPKPTTSPGSSRRSAAKAQDFPTCPSPVITSLAS